MLKNNSLNEPYTVSTLFAFVSGYYISFALGAAIFLISSLALKKVNTWGYILYIYLISVVAFTNYSDVNYGDYDINRYYTYYTLFHDCRTLPGLVLLLNESRDVLFYLIVWLSTFIFPNDPRWFGFLFTFISSLLLFFAFRNYAMKIFKDDITRKLPSLLFFCLGFICIIRFIDYTNAYRQHFAFALLLYVTSINISKISRVLLLLATCFIHTSNFVIVAIYYVLKLTKLYKQPRKLWCYSLFASLFCVALLISLLSSDSYFVGYLVGDGALGRDNKIRIIMLIVSSLLTYFYAKLNIFMLRSKDNEKQIEDSLRSLSIISSVLCVISILFFAQSTMIIRYAFNLEDFIVVISPIIYYLVNPKVKKKEIIYYKYSDRGFEQCVLKTSWFLFILYNLLKIGEGEFEYMIFSTYGVWSSINSIIHTNIPVGLI